MEQEKTPGVYINELDAFPNSVVEVPTAVPAFIGYTEMAMAGTRDLTGRPTRITSFQEYLSFFGGAAESLFDLKVSEQGTYSAKETAPRYRMSDAVRQFYEAGGEVCYVVSLGVYSGAGPRLADYPDDIWTTLAKEQEPTMCLCPDAVSLEFEYYASLTTRMMTECANLQDRIALLDLHGGDGPDLYAAIAVFRDKVDLGPSPSYGVIYAPWLYFTQFELDAATYARLSFASRKDLADRLGASSPTVNPQAHAEWVAALAELRAETPDPAKLERTDSVLRQLSPDYLNACKALQKAMNLMPPSGAMAGIYAYVDNNIGVWKAPANLSVPGASEPAVAISTQDQEDMNAPLGGKAVNAIRSFVGRGLLVWGARTLDANSQDWRYINVRRTVMMIEQSVKLAMKAFVFSPNDANTWQSVKAMIENYLTNVWKSGGLQGAKPSDAFSVDVGLGSTMTGNDIVEGIMKVTVKIAVVHPAEFIILTFQQQQAES